MKPPVKIDALMEEWGKDSRIDKTEPGMEIIKGGELHSKYLNILTHHSLLVKQSEENLKTMRSIKWQWYKGDLNNPEDLKEYGLEPNQKSIRIQNIPMYMDSDEDLRKLILKVALHQEIVDYCNKVIKELNNRVWSLRAYMDWEKYLQGKL